MKNQKIFSKILKNIFILKFVKKSMTFFSAKNFFCDNFFVGKKVFMVFDGSGSDRPHTHTIFDDFFKSEILNWFSVFDKIIFKQTMNTVSKNVKS